MKHLFSPWRSAYINQGLAKSCFLCRAAREKQGEAGLVLFRNRKMMIVMNRFPYNNGHLLIAPRRHIAQVESLTVSEGREMFELMQRSIRVIKRELKPDGFNIGMNLGRIAGAGLADHLHLHVVPRWSGDTNFMPVVADTKLISEGLAQTYRRLHERFLSARSDR